MTKKSYYIILTLMLSLSGINKTYADCTQEEIKEFKKVEEEYKVTYELNKQTKYYNVIFYRDINNKYTYIVDEDLNSKNNITATDTTIVYESVAPGEYKIGIINIESECKDSLKNITIQVPRYNKYSEEPLCEGIEEFYLCQPTYDKEIDYDTFVSRVNTYKKTKEQKEELNTEDNNETEKENELLVYIQNNLVQVIIIAIFIILVIITTIVTIKQSRKSRRLE